MEVLIQRRDSTVKIPEYQTVGAAGADLCAHIPAPFQLGPGQRVIIPTGLAFGIPVGFEGQIRPRSGLATKGITVLNAPGTIDADYRGEVGVILINLSNEPYIIKKGERIAQVIIAPVEQATFSVILELNKTERGEGGFGSTGTDG